MPLGLMLLAGACGSVAGTAQPPTAEASEASPAEAPAPKSSSSTDLSYASEVWAGRKLSYQPWTVQAGGGGDFVPGSTGEYMHGGANAAAGVTWFPSPTVPLGVRVDGSYGWFRPEQRLLEQGGVGYNSGQRSVYGADLDLQWDFGRLSTKQKVYLMGGFGEYRLGTSLQKLSQAPYVCGTNFCGRYSTVLAKAGETSAWEPSVNAGLGWAMALDAHVSMFVEARYERLFTSGVSTQYFPVRVGLRF